LFRVRLSRLVVLSELENTMAAISNLASVCFTSPIFIIAIISAVSRFWNVLAPTMALSSLESCFEDREIVPVWKTSQCEIPFRILGFFQL
jgi:hypothetical protein